MMICSVSLLTVKMLTMFSEGIWGKQWVQIESLVIDDFQVSRHRIAGNIIVLQGWNNFLYSIILYIYQYDEDFNQAVPLQNTLTNNKYFDTMSLSKNDPVCAVTT